MFFEMLARVHTQYKPADTNLLTDKKPILQKYKTKRQSKTIKGGEGSVQSASESSIISKESSSDSTE